MSHVGDPIKFAEAVTPDNDIVFDAPTRCLFIGTAGDVTVRMAAQGNVVTFADVPAGILGVQCDKVLATGTAALDIVRGW